MQTHEQLLDNFFFHLKKLQKDGIIIVTYPILYEKKHSLKKSIVYKRETNMKFRAVMDQNSLVI